MTASPTPAIIANVAEPSPSTGFTGQKEGDEQRSETLTPRRWPAEDLVHRRTSAEVQTRLRGTNATKNGRRTAPRPLSSLRRADCPGEAKTFGVSITAVGDSGIPGSQGCGQTAPATVDASTDFLCPAVLEAVRGRGEGARFLGSSSSSESLCSCANTGRNTSTTPSSP